MTSRNIFVNTSFNPSPVLNQQLTHAEKDAKSNEANIKAIKYKIWEIRTSCNR